MNQFRLGSTTFFRSWTGTEHRQQSSTLAPKLFSAELNAAGSSSFKYSPHPGNTIVPPRSWSAAGHQPLSSLVWISTYLSHTCHWPVEAIMLDGRHLNDNCSSRPRQRRLDAVLPACPAGRTGLASRSILRMKIIIKCISGYGTYHRCSGVSPSPSTT